MKRTTLFGVAVLSVVSLALAMRSVVGDDQPAGGKPAGAPEMKLPPGWTAEDMKACVLAGIPGKSHEFLAKGVGQWTGKSTMWMAPDTDPIKSDCTLTVSSVMDGRYTKAETKGDMPGMGPYHGMGLYGFDNVSQQFVSTWVDNHSTGMMNGTGTLSDDGKTLTWNYSFNCPVTKKPALMREVETITGPDTRTLEMWGSNPKTGKEFKMMTIEFTKK